MPNFPRIALCLLLGLLTACTSMKSAQQTALTFIIVRHAEKAQDDPRDPVLTEAGRARAQALATALADAPVVAVYASGFRRTQQTAAPTARVHGLPVTPYDARQPAHAFAAQLQRAHRSGHVLVVGHSNTAPGIAAALCGCDVAPMEETEYDRRMTVQFARNGAVTLISASVR